MEKIVAPMEDLPVPEVKSTGNEEPVAEEDTPSKISKHKIERPAI